MTTPKKKQSRGVSAHELKRRLMQRMAGMHWIEAEKIAVTVREHVAAMSFLAGRSVEHLCNDSDCGGAWDRTRMETAIRNRSALLTRKAAR